MICVLIGAYSWNKGWSFFPAFLFSFIGFIFVGLVFVAIRGKGPKYPRG